MGWPSLITRSRGGFFDGDLRGGEKITEGPQHLFDLAAVALDDLRIETDAGHLHENMAVGAGLVDETNFSRADDFPGGDQVERDAEFHGEHIDRAHGKNAERHRRIADAVHDFVDRAVAACGDNGPVALLDRALGLGLGVAGAFGRADHHVAGEPLQPFEARPDPARGRIRDNTDAIQGWLGMMACGSVGRMRSFRWVIITGAVVVGLAILAIAIGVLWLNTFIHSPAFKAEVESKASQTLGGPVQVQSIDFDVFRGVKLQGLVTQIDPSHAGGQGALKSRWPA